MNRKGILCKDCIDGFAVSFTSMGRKCSNCTDARYGIPLYLLIELAPTTVFYLIILIFQIHMTSIILYCSIIQFLLVTDRYLPIERIVLQYENNHLLFKVNAFFYSLFNLDVFAIFYHHFVSVKVLISYTQYSLAVYQFCTSA